MSPIEQFEQEKKQNIENQGADSHAVTRGREFMKTANSHKYSYNFKWLGRPIIQYPQDIVALQEIIWETKPDIIIETGIAHGGSLILSASILELIGGNGHVIGVDIDIREYNKVEIEQHSLSKRITMIQGSSVAPEIVQKVKDLISPSDKVLLILDSNHTHEHVYNELLCYANLVTIGSYAIVFDTVIEDLGDDYDWQGRNWGKGNNAKTAVWQFLKENDSFITRNDIDAKLLISVAPEGYLQRIK